VPVFSRQSRADIAWRAALLYFVRGWSIKGVADRFRMSRERAGQIVSGWRALAVNAGYIQEILENPFTPGMDCPVSRNSPTYLSY
jgi:hypothetical protein